MYIQTDGNICHASFELSGVTIFIGTVDSGLDMLCLLYFHCRWVQSLVVFGHQQLKLLGSMLATFKEHRAPAPFHTCFCRFDRFLFIPAICVAYMTTICAGFQVGST